MLLGGLKSDLFGVTPEQELSGSGVAAISPQPSRVGPRMKLNAHVPLSLREMVVENQLTELDSLLCEAQVDLESPRLITYHDSNLVKFRESQAVSVSKPYTTGWEKWQKAFRIFMSVYL